MPARRFFIEGAHADGETIIIDGQDAHKIVRVLRLQSGEDIELIDSAATLFDARVTIETASVRALLRNGRRAEASRVRIDVAQAIPKGQKMDFVVEKLSELGVHAIVPFTSERSIVRDAGVAKIERWRRLAHTAAQQSGRRDIATVRDAIEYRALVQHMPEYDVVLFPWEVAEQQPLRARLPALVAGARRILIVVGPEGGFSHDEARAAERAGAAVVSLGAQILRTETAALFVVSVLDYLLG